MKQIWFTDIHEWYRIGGIDWGRIAELYDAIGIRAVVGDHVDELLEYHVENALRINKRFVTYCIPSENIPTDEQVDLYLEAPGVDLGLIAGDVEPEFKGGKMGPEWVYRKFFERLDVKRTDKAWYYSNYAYTKAIGFPAWVYERVVWWAEYPYEYLLTKYRQFESYLARNPWKIPKWAVASGITPTVHQFTDYGNAQYYHAKAVTEDPIFKVGIKSADLSVGLVPVADFLGLWDVLGKQPLTMGEKVDLLWMDHPEYHPG